MHGSSEGCEDWDACPDDSSPPAPSHQSETPPTKLFLHREMVRLMMIRAKQHGRDFVDDAIRLITVYFTRRTNNVSKILHEWTDADVHKRGFEAMVKVYGIRNQTDFYEPHPTLARIAEALPHMSLVMCDQIAFGAQTYLQPWVSNKELGVFVHRHFKMNYFPGLVDVQVGGLKAEAGLLLSNLCFARVMMKTSKGRMSSVQAFVVACRFASNLMAQRLAPSESRRKFSEYVKLLPMEAHVMNEVWNTVLGGLKIHGPDICLTSFHESVIQAQPLDLAKWKYLLREIDS